MRLGRKLHELNTSVFRRFDYVPFLFTSEIYMKKKINVLLEMLVRSLLGCSRCGKVPRLSNVVTSSSRLCYGLVGLAPQMIRLRVSLGWFRYSGVLLVQWVPRFFCNLHPVYASAYVYLLFKKKNYLY